MRDLADLPPEEQVEAIIASTSAPVSKEWVLEVAHFDINSLSQENKQKINDVFCRWRVTPESTLEHLPAAVRIYPEKYKSPELQYGPLFWVPQHEQAVVFERITVATRSVKKRIAVIGLGRLLAARSPSDG